MLISIPNGALAEPSREDLLAQLIARLGAEKAAEFMTRLERKHTQETKLIPQKPVWPKEQKPAPQESTAIEVEHISEPAIEKPADKPIAAPGITPEERIKFDAIITKFETYTQGIYKCIEAFFSKRNIDPYKSHVQCFKNQLHYLQQEIMQNYPRAESPEGAKLFKSLEAIGRALTKSQDMMCTTLETNYSTGMFAGTKLGLAMSGISKLIDSQRALVDKEIGVIRNQLRNAHEQEMLKKINALYMLLNKNFDFGNNKKYDELLSILNHRVKR